MRSVHLLWLVLCVAAISCASAEGAATDTALANLAPTATHTVAATTPTPFEPGAEGAATNTAPANLAPTSTHTVAPTTRPPIGGAGAEGAATETASADLTPSATHIVAATALPPIERTGRDCVVPVLQMHPVRLGPYEPSTGRAGDLVFASETQFNRIFMEYGFAIPAESTSNGQDKHNPQPTYLAPMGTHVLSPVDGVVDRVSDLWSTSELGDVSVMILPDGLPDGCYLVVEAEHVINVSVVDGERVSAGQVIAEVGPLSSQSNAGLGLVELGVLTGTGDGRPLHVCPYSLFDPAVAETQVGLMTQLMVAWETFAEDASLYDESAWVDGAPGCSAGDLTE